MKITDRLTASSLSDPKALNFSFEFFPPKTDLGVANLLNRMERMAQLRPIFVSVTWPASGSEKAAAIRSLDLCEAAMACRDGGMTGCCHLTCTNLARETIESALSEAKRAGVQNILALRGDPPRGAEHWTPVDPSFRNATDLVKYIRTHYGTYFCIGVAAYPEAHPDSPSMTEDLRYLKEKVDAGADFIVTQMFYNPDAYVDWYKKARELGIKVPILAGIMPIQGYTTFRRLIQLTRVNVPDSVHEALEPIKHDDAAVKDFGVQYAVAMITKLSAAGIRNFHLSTLNLERTVHRILEELNCLPSGTTSVVLRGRKVNMDRSGQTHLETWDDFPNGRWGDARSPAYGEIDGYGVSLHVEPSEALRIWGTPESLQSLSRLFISYCLGTLTALPWSPDPVLAESRCIAKHLADLNRNFFFTVGSQPAVDGLPSDDPVVGWGPRDPVRRGYVYQKAFVEFFVSSDKVHCLMEHLSESKQVTLYAGNKQGEVVSNVLDDTRNAVTWGVFVGQEIVQPTIVEKESFLAWKEEAFAIWHEWSLLYPAGSHSRELLNGICESWWLVNVVYDDYKAEGSALFDLISGCYGVKDHNATFTEALTP